MTGAGLASSRKGQHQSETGGVPGPLLVVRDLVVARDDHVLLAGLSFSLAAGDLLQLEGPNGVGKTSLMRVLTTTAPHDHGAISWRGADLPGARTALRSEFLFIGHLAGIKRSLTPRENLAWYGADGDAAEAALAWIGLGGYEDTPCHQLSAGQNRRVALARLHFSGARLWILDEPFTALDKSGVATLEARLRAHCAAGGMVILTSHQDLAIDGLQRLKLQEYVPQAGVELAEVASVY